MACASTKVRPRETRGSEGASGREMGRGYADWIRSGRLFLRGCHFRVQMCIRLDPSCVLVEMERSSCHTILHLAIAIASPFYAISRNGTDWF